MMKTPVRLMAAAALLCCVGCGPSGSDSSVSDTGTDASVDGGTDSGPTGCVGASDGVCVLSGTDPTAPYDDLAPLGDIIGSATVVGFGESVHRSGGLLAMKGRLVRYAVEELGFRVLAMETEWLRAEMVRTWLTTCTGTAEDAVLAGIRDTWQDQSIADLLQFLCDWNQTNPSDTVTFFGFNNFQPWDDYPALESFINNSLPAQAALISDLAMCEGVMSPDEATWMAGFPGMVGDPEFNACMNALDALDLAIDADEANLLTMMTMRELTTVRMHIISLRGWESYQYWDNLAMVNSNGLTGRDAALAELFWLQWELDYPGTKVAIISHNGHINHGSDTVNTTYPSIAKMSNVFEGAIRMGNLLEARYGADYVPVALICYQCGLTNQLITKLPGGIMPPSGNPLVENTLNMLGYEYLLADLNPPAGSPSAFVPGQVYGWYVPIGWTLAGVVESVPADQFDAIIYMNLSPIWSPL